MDKIVISLGVHKKIKKHSKKGLLKKVIHYLKSDTYMFAPLVSPQSSDFLPTNTLPTGVEIMKPSKEKNQKLLKKVGEYLKSDCYMYAPLICRQPSHDFDANIVTPPSGTSLASEKGNHSSVNPLTTLILKAALYSDKLIAKQ
ncbi:unnamed protein product [Camellia sinensis]